MKSEQINSLVQEGSIAGYRGKMDLIETHISWIILCQEQVYKIKKPVQYSFLDFSTLEKRKFYCEREILLNNRLTEGIYLDVQPVKRTDNDYVIGNVPGELVDYAVKMNRMDSQKQMDLLLKKNLVSLSDLRNLAEKMGSFHHRTMVITQKDLMDIQSKFNDLEKEKDYLHRIGYPDYCKIIDHAIKTSHAFNKQYSPLIQERLKSGFVRDCHGDLHSRNIFFIPEPQPFDCIEFNDDYRQIDVLNDVAFLCMDLDYFDREDLSESFISYYNVSNRAIRTPSDERLFIYFKAYRANIRAKINSLRAQSSQQTTETNRYLVETCKYLGLLNRYMDILSEC